MPVHWKSDELITIASKILLNANTLMMKDEIVLYRMFYVLMRNGIQFT